MRILIVLLAFLVGCASPPPKETALTSCLDIFAIFVTRNADDKIEAIDSGFNFAYARVMNRSQDTMESILITKNFKKTRYGYPVGKCQNVDQVLNIYMLKENISEVE